MTDAAMATKFEELMGKMAELIKAQSPKEEAQFSTDELNHAYICLVEGVVDEKANDVLNTVIGPDWSEGLEYSEDDEDVAESEAMDAELAETIEQTDETDPIESINTLAAALMVTCRELGWLNTSRAAHDQWFFAKDAGQ